MKSLIFTVLGARLVAPSAVASSVRVDAISAFFFVSNWRFLAQGTDYFQRGQAPSPLQHYWSLSVEEQFYFVVPWLMLVVLLGLKKAKVPLRWDRRSAAAIMLIVLASSFFYALHMSIESPTGAYFSTLTRIWELAIGALLACLAPGFDRLKPRYRTVLAWIGIAGLVLSMWAINSFVRWPAPWALLPTCSAALVIVAGTGGTARFLWPLTNPVSRFVGDISYSLYLWHFPLIVLGGYVLGAGWTQKMVILGFALALASASYYAIEKPVHTSPLLQRFRTSEKRKRAWRTWWGDVGFGARLGGLSMLLLVIALISQQALNVGRVDASAAPPVLSVPVATASTSGSSLPAGVAKLQSELTSALTATQWPASLPIADVASTRQPQAPEQVSPCGFYLKYSLSACTFGNGPKKALILGSSIGMTWSQPIISALGSGWTVTVHATFACPFSSITIPSDDVGVAQTCAQRNVSGVEAIKQIEPDIVFIGDSYRAHTTAAGKALTAQEWADSVDVNLQRAGSAVKKVVILSAPPAGKAAADCYKPNWSPARCVATMNQFWRDSLSADVTLARKYSGTVIDTSRLFCVEGYCPLFAGKTVVRSDDAHMTLAYQQKIVTPFKELLTQAKIS